MEAAVGQESLRLGFTCHHAHHLRFCDALGGDGEPLSKVLTGGQPKETGLRLWLALLSPLMVCHRNLMLLMLAVAVRRVKPTEIKIMDSSKLSISQPQLTSTALDSCGKP